ncbi:MAG: alpha/beta hydrolase [Anaerolineae bacterium]|nr:alpha/beta hydrolase [Anaerolineae bacterium]MDW8173896.1 alpha/beta hydrolase [Anaerolineae bacterium]
MSAITIDGDLVHYEKLGRGRPIVLIHGWLGSWRYWIPLMQQLHLKYSVYALDLMGFGDSAKNPQRYSLARQVELLTLFLDQLGIPKTALIGHGLGGMVAAEFALKSPDKVARLLLSSMPLFDPGDLKDRVPAGQRVLLTQRDRFSLAPPMPEEQPENKANDKPDDATLMRRPGLPSAPSAPTQQLRPSGSALPNDHPTIERISPLDRQRLMDAANARIPSPVPPSAPPPVGPVVNPLADALQGKPLLALLEKCFKRSDPVFDKLRVDVEKQDERAVSSSVQGFNITRQLDNLRKITAPTVMVHGLDDPIVSTPSEDVWQYLTVNKDDVFLPIAIPSVRHFPMLEHEPFARLVNDFLETAEIGKLEIRERWRRRTY